MANNDLITKDRYETLQSKVTLVGIFALLLCCLIGGIALMWYNMWVITEYWLPILLWLVSLGLIASSAFILFVLFNVCAGRKGK